MPVLMEQSVAEQGPGRPAISSKRNSILPRTALGRSSEAPMPNSVTTFDATAWRRRLRVALGQEPADLVLTGGEIIDVFAGNTYRADVAIADGVIAGIGSYPQ